MMLDIVMPVHAPNLGRVAYRGMRPNKRGLEEEAILGSLPSAIDLVGTPGKVVLSIQGGERQDFEAAETYLENQALAWQIVHNDEIGTYREALIDGLAQCQSQLVAVIPPWIEVTDPQWVQRMMWPIGRDQTCLLCTTYEQQGGAKDLAPNIVTQRVWPGGDFFVARREKLVENLILGQTEDVTKELAEAAALNGWRIWAHPGVRFTYLEHNAHTRKSTTKKAKQPAADSDSRRSSAPLQ